MLLWEKPGRVDSWATLEPFQAGTRASEEDNTLGRERGEIMIHLCLPQSCLSVTTPNCCPLNPPER